MLRYKLLSLDLDGTLFDGKMNISAKNEAAIQKLTDMGVYVVPNTGRGFGELPKCVKNNKNFKYILTSNGSVILNTESGEKDTVCMPRELTHRVLDILNEYDTVILMHYDGGVYMDADGHDIERYRRDYRLTDNYCEVISRSIIPVEDNARFCEEMDEAEMFCAFFRYDGELEECRQRLKDTGELLVASSEPNNLEIVYRHATKGATLLRLGKALGIDVSEMIGVGDSPNDITLLKSAGLGLAVGNALDSLKDIADDVICTNEEHAVDFILKKYFL